MRTEHLPSAFAVATAKGKVQFAARDSAFFDKLAGREGTLEVFVFPAGPASPDFPRDSVCMRGVYGGAAEFQDLTIRPDSAKGESTWPVYWTVEFIEKPEHPPHISAFLTKDGSKHKKTPRRPMIATIDL